VSLCLYYLLHLYFQYLFLPSAFCCKLGSLTKKVFQVLVCMESLAWFWALPSVPPIRPTWVARHQRRLHAISCNTHMLRSLHALLRALKRLLPLLLYRGGVAWLSDQCLFVVAFSPS
jgi:hypothetical protein